MSRDVHVRFCVRLRGKFPRPTRLAGSEEGGETAAILLSLVQTCQAHKINPQEYLEDVMRRLMSHNSQKLEELLPEASASERAPPNTS